MPRLVKKIVSISVEKSADKSVSFSTCRNSQRTCFLGMIFTLLGKSFASNQGGISPGFPNQKSWVSNNNGLVKLFTGESNCTGFIFQPLPDWPSTYNYVGSAAHCFYPGPFSVVIDGLTLPMTFLGKSNTSDFAVGVVQNVGVPGFELEWGCMAQDSVAMLRAPSRTIPYVIGPKQVTERNYFALTNGETTIGGESGSPLLNANNKVSGVASQASSVAVFSPIPSHDWFRGLSTVLINQDVGLEGKTLTSLSPTENLHSQKNPSSWVYFDNGNCLVQT